MLVTALGLPANDIGEALTALPEDSQAGNLMARKDDGPNRTALANDEVQRISEVLAMHPRKLTADMVLPGTLSP